MNVKKGDAITITYKIHNECYTETLTVSEINTDYNFLKFDISPYYLDFSMIKSIKNNSDKFEKLKNNKIKLRRIK